MGSAMGIIRSYKDLRVYQDSYAASIEVIKKMIPPLPKEERFDLVNQLRRSAKAIPRLIAEGYAKKHQKKHFQRYIDDAIGECNEMNVSLSHCKDLYARNINTVLCDKLIDIYDKTGKGLYRLGQNWQSFTRGD